MQESEILLNLHRKYSKDEEVSWLIQDYKKKLSEVSIELGKTKSELAELQDLILPMQYENKKLKELNTSLKSENKSLRSGEVIKSLTQQLTLKSKKISEQQKTIGSLISKLPKK